MKNKPKTIATTFNMSVELKEKAQIYIASNNRTIEERGKGDKLNLGILINKVLEQFFLEKGLDE